MLRPTGLSRCYHPKIGTYHAYKYILPLVARLHMNIKGTSFFRNVNNDRERSFRCLARGFGRARDDFATALKLLLFNMFP